MIILEIRQELEKYSDKKYKINAQRFFKEKLEQPFMLKSVIFKKISAKCFKKISYLPKDEIITICEEILQTDLSIRKSIAFDWAYRCRKGFEEKDFKTFENWIDKHVTNWGLCDHICGKVFGHFIYKFPKYTANTKKWTNSPNRWFRRASAVSLIYSLRKKELLTEAFKTANILLQDKEDMVQKGYGWMLKEASKHYPEKVFQFVMQNKRFMPRTALRYAIEKLAFDKKRQAMKKDWYKK